jgi:mannosyltransferase
MRRRWLLLALLLLAAALRFHRIEVQSFWNDEGNSARLSERSLTLIVEGTASDVHPPLYYLLLRGWRELAGDSEFGLRAFSAFAGILAVAATGALARRWWRGPPATAATTLFAALSPPLVYYSQEARMYELLALLAALSTLLLVALLPLLRGGKPTTPRRRALVAAFYLLSVAAGLYTHYFFPAVLAVHALIAAVSLGPRHRRAIVAWAALPVLALVLYLPWLPIFLRQTGGRPGNELGLLAFGGEALRWLALGATASDGSARWAAPLILGGALLALLPWPVADRRPQRFAWLALAGVLLPLLLMWLVQATRPAFYKFLVAVVPFLALLWGQGVARLALVPGRARPLALALGLALVAVQVGGSGPWRWLTSTTTRPTPAPITAAWQRASLQMTIPARALSSTPPTSGRCSPTTTATARPSIPSPAVHRKRTR